MQTATTGSRRAQLLAEIAFLRREAAKLNNPSTYARCAKYQRLANVKDKEHAELTAGPAVPELADGLLLLGRAVKVRFCVPLCCPSRVCLGNPFKWLCSLDLGFAASVQWPIAIAKAAVAQTLITLAFVA